MKKFIGITMMLACLSSFAQTFKIQTLDVLGNSTFVGTGTFGGSLVGPRIQVGIYQDAGGNILGTSNPNLPTIGASSGFGTGAFTTASNTMGFAVFLGTTPGNYGVVTLPSISPQIWYCSATSLLYSVSINIKQQGAYSNAAMLVAYSATTGATTSLSASDMLMVQCIGMLD